jgi:putative hydrolase of the HAD superfamily
MERQFLIFDADDTLWENNIYFEDAFDEFCTFLAHSSLRPSEVRAVLDEIEILNTQIHGYGARSFGRNLTACFEHLSERGVSQDDLERVLSFAHQILDRPVELIDGVQETVKQLAARHDLTIFTKGDAREQQRKIDDSGLRDFFAHTAIVKEKNEPAYRALAEQRGLDPEKTWMIGNSPKSDIRPALTAGLNAVFIPHPRTWSLELADLPPDNPRMKKVSNFRELSQHF